ncbi:MAG: ABC transporter ATP-binding protein [Candidatus Aminicenantes bacterium]|nr:ABC transporter ATP-binding protein [Candidatus Aminicenantes bacterium]
MPEAVVEIKGLTKDFKTLRAVDDVSFCIYPGEILGLLGPNGAGKTTIIHMILGLTTPTSGEIRMFGCDLKKTRQACVQNANFSSTYVSMPNSLTVKECLKVFARLYKVKNRNKRITEVLNIFEIEDIQNHMVRTLSSGQQTRLNLAKSLINSPKILLLDEPTASLDPDIADKTRTMLRSITRERNISILYTSHNMKEMEEISDRLIFLHHGKIIAQGKPKEVIKNYRGKNLEEVFLKVAREGHP